MASESCKWCGDSCKLKEYGNNELAMCYPCFNEWTRIVDP